jgi:hypothetical protein
MITDPAFVPADGQPAEQALTVFPVGEPPFTTVAHEDPEHHAATWHWPEE